MYFPLSSEVFFPLRHTIGIFDLDNTSIAKDTKKFLQERQNQDKLISLTSDIPKSFILTEDNQVYFTNYGTNTMEKRCFSK